MRDLSKEAWRAFGQVLKLNFTDLKVGNGKLKEKVLVYSSKCIKNEWIKQWFRWLKRRKIQKNFHQGAKRSQNE